MDNFIFCNPTKIVFGKDMELEVGKLIKEYGGTNVLIHYGSSSAIKSGLIDRVKTALDLSFIKHVELGGVKPNPRASLVYEGIRLVKENKIDFILAVGGGSVIDSSKAIGMGALYDGDFWDIYCGKYTPTKTLKVATILTIAAAGSESSGSSVGEILLIILAIIVNISILAACYWVFKNKCSSSSSYSSSSYDNYDVILIKRDD